MAQVEKIKALIREMMDQEMENYKDAVSLGTQDETSAPVVYTILQVLLTKIEKMPNEPANEDLEKEVYEHLWKGRMGADVSKPIYFSYDELLEVARHFAAWQKQLLMKDADDYIVDDDNTIKKFYDTGGVVGKPIIFGSTPDSINVGDHVKVIVIKEE